MNEELFNRINQYFINREYEQIPTDSDTVAMYGVYDKSNLYLINVIDLKDGYGLDPERYLEYKQMTMQQFMSNQADKIILLNLIISDNAEALTDQFNYVPDMTEQFIDVLWFIDKTGGQLLIPGKQLKSVLGIQKDLRKLLRNEELSYYKVQQNGGWPILTVILLLTNIAVWIYAEYIGSSTDSETLLSLGALYAPLVIDSGEYLRLIQSMFLHIGFIHLFHNMFALYIFGYRLEQYISRWKFMVIYLGSGIVGSLMSLGVDVLFDRVVIAAGASGAVYGLMGSLFVITTILRRSVDGVNAYVLMTMFLLGIIHSVVTPGISITAHLGGFVGGILLTLLVLKDSKRSDQADEPEEPMEPEQ